MITLSNRFFKRLREKLQQSVPADLLHLCHKNDRSRYVQGILDGGSQQSFVTEDLAVKLNLRVLGETRVAFNTFGSASPTSAEKRKVVQVPLRSQYSTDIHIIQAIVVPVLCHDIPALTADSHFMQKLHLEGKIIADEKNFLDQLVDWS